MLLLLNNIIDGQGLQCKFFPMVFAIENNDLFNDESIFPSNLALDVPIPGKIFALLEDITYLDCTITFPIDRELDIYSNKELLKQYLKNWTSKEHLQ